MLISGGGTGGHVYPALAVAEELADRGTPRSSIRFLGAARGIEARVVPAAGFTVDLLPGRGVQRRLTLENAAAVGGIGIGLARAWRIVGRFEPHVTLGVGGYASVPGVVASRLRRVPVVVHEQNAAPGLANRVAVRLGAVATTSLPDTPLQDALLVGNPVRGGFVGLERRPDPDRPLVLAFGGSLGAERINEAVAGLAERWRDRTDRRVRHVTGTRNVERWRERVEATRSPSDRLEYELVAYEERMAEWYGRASVVVSRAGAVTVAELAASGTPSVLVPLPGAPGDHQTRNAEALAATGGAVVVADSECSPARLEGLLDELLASPARLEAMGAAAAGLGRPDAAARLADVVESAARSGGAGRSPDDIASDDGAAA